MSLIQQAVIVNYQSSSDNLGKGAQRLDVLLKNIPKEKLEQIESIKLEWRKIYLSYEGGGDELCPFVEIKFK